MPGYEFQTGVMWDGALVFGPLGFRELKVMQQEIAPLGNHYLHVSFGYGEPMRLVDRQGTNSPVDPPQHRRGPASDSQHRNPRRRSGLDGDRVRPSFGRPAEQWLDAKQDDMLVTHAVFRVENAGYAKRTGHLWMHFGDTGQVQFGYKCQQLPEIGKEIPFKFDAPFGRLGDGVRFVIPKPSAGELVCHAEVKDVQGVGGTPKNVIEWKVPLAPGEAAELRLIIPYGVVRPNVAQKLAELDSAEQLAEVKGFWKKLQYGCGQIHTPDPFVNDYLVAVAGQMAEQVAWRSSIDRHLDVQDQSEQLRRLLAVQRGEGVSRLRSSRAVRSEPPRVAGLHRLAHAGRRRIESGRHGARQRAGRRRLRRHPRFLGQLRRVDRQSAAGQSRPGDLGAGRALPRHSR